jgi:hypothetical protein
MVVIQDFQQDQWAARRFVHSLGASECVLDQSEAANPDLDWMTVIQALDRVFLSHGSTMGQALFMRERQVALSGDTPLEALTEVGGPARVCRAAHIFAATAPRRTSPMSRLTPNARPRAVEKS